MGWVGGQCDEGKCEEIRQARRGTKPGVAQPAAAGSCRQPWSIPPWHRAKALASHPRGQEPGRGRTLAPLPPGHGQAVMSPDTLRGNGGLRIDLKGSGDSLPK